MGSTKKTPAKAGKTAAKAHQERGDNQVQTPVPKTPASRSRKKKSGEATPSEWNFTSAPPTAADRAKNGRVEGRNLITWTRPRMTEKLLLHMQYECSRYKIELPWDHIAHRLHPGSSGGALLQHLNRLRATLIAEGHLVPPICQKPGSRVVVDQSIRGYVRKFPDGDNTRTTRPVTFNERMEDRRFILPGAVDNKNSEPASEKEDTPVRTVSARKTTVIKKEPTPDSDAMRPDNSYTQKRRDRATRKVENLRRSERAAALPTVSYDIEDEDNCYSSVFYHDKDGLSGDQDEEDDQGMSPSAGPLQTARRHNARNAPRSNANTQGLVRNAPVSYQRYSQNGYLGQTNGYFNPMANVVTQHPMYFRHDQYGQNPEDLAANGYVVAEDEEQVELSYETRDDRRSAELAGVNGEAQMFHQQHNAVNFNAANQDAVNSHPQHIPVVAFDDYDDGGATAQDQAIYDEDDVPSQGIAISDEDENEGFEIIEQDQD